MGSQLDEVKVDTETGQVRILRLAPATDAGKAINPMGVEGQIEGSADQGLGFALMEEMKVEEGVYKNAHLNTYLLLTAADIPKIDSLVVEVPDSTGPYGAKGVGEPATIPTAPAIFNTIANAIGKRICTTPASPEKILNVLETREEGTPLVEIPYPHT